MTAYEVLGVSERASAEEIRLAWKACAMREHPDRNGGEPTSRTALVSRAWGLLGTPEARAAYDARLRRQRGGTAGRTLADAIEVLDGAQARLRGAETALRGMRTGIEDADAALRPRARQVQEVAGNLCDALGDLFGAVLGAPSRGER